MDIESRLVKLEHGVDALIHRGQGRVFTFSIVVGTSACDAKCPFCVSKTTGFDQLPPSKTVNIIRFRKAARLAQMRQATTVLFTGKGEPTLYPAEITHYLNILEPFNFPIIEIQTNALQIGRLLEGRKSTLTKETLESWLNLGLNTIAISVVDVNIENNQLVYNKNYPDLKATIDFLHEIGFSVRLCVMMQNGMVDSPDKIDSVVTFCKNNKIEQLTIRPIRRPEHGADGSKEFIQYIEERGLTESQISTINKHIRRKGTHILTMAHGAHAAFVFDVEGQNLCLSDCLTVESNTDDIRTLIFYGTGEIAYDWQYTGARIM